MGNMENTVKKGEKKLIHFFWVGSSVTIQLCKKRRNKECGVAGEFSIHSI